MVNEKTLKVLIEVASKSADPEAVEGVLAVQELLQENSDLKNSVEALKSTSKAETDTLKTELDRATRTLASWMSRYGVIDKEEEETKPVDRRALAQKFFG